ncbi:MAG: sulfatase-like hydrolase/transferase, partial [Planctomycetota bacterium]
AGYETAAFVSTYLLKPHACGLERGFDVYDAEMNSRNLGHDDFERRSRETVDRAVKWLAATAGRSRFLWVHLYDPHGLYDPADPENRERFLRETDRPDLRPEQIVSYQEIHGEFDPDVYVARYDGEIFEADAALGRLMEAAGTEALIAVGADHGESLGEDDYWFRHGALLNRASLHVPLVIAGPGVSEGRRHAGLVRNLDVAPTLLGLAGLSPLRDARGRSLVGDLSGPAVPAYAESRRGGGRLDRTGIDMGYKVSLTMPDSHLVWRVGRETCPHPALSRWIRKMPDRRVGEEPPDDVDDALRGLGYIR